MAAATIATVATFGGFAGVAADIGGILGSGVIAGTTGAAGIGLLAGSAALRPPRLHLTDATGMLKKDLATNVNYQIKFDKKAENAALKSSKKLGIDFRFMDNLYDLQSSKRNYITSLDVSHTRSADAKDDCINKLVYMTRQILKCIPGGGNTDVSGKNIMLVKYALNHLLLNKDHDQAIAALDTVNDKDNQAKLRGMILTELANLPQEADSTGEEQPEVGILLDHDDEWLQDQHEEEKKLKEDPVYKNEVESMRKLADEIFNTVFTDTKKEDTEYDIYNTSMDEINTGDKEQSYSAGGDNEDVGPTITAAADGDEEDFEPSVSDDPVKQKEITDERHRLLEILFIAISADNDEIMQIVHQDGIDLNEMTRRHQEKDQLNVTMNGLPV